MKNVLNNSKKGFLMVAMFVTLLSFANEAPFYTIKNDAERTSLTLNNVKQGNLLSIKDNNGIVIYKELILQTGTYTKGFDLTSLPNGNYMFELNKDVEIQSIPFNVLAKTVTFIKDSEKTIFKPVTRVKGDVVFMSRLSLSKAPLEIAIYFTDGTYNSSELIYSETIKNTENANRIFKLTGKNKGDYKIVYTTEGHTFIEEIK
ncbi:hypothetical protein ACFQ1R_11055 [Mariniflexile jejuense]|uniref:Secreted protein (Por secretion system target) n=1 Tax=Mariniflexile jejuense TaxID=1173582 RepID=A0ABW3JJJ4_9FLAO